MFSRASNFFRRSIAARIAGLFSILFALCLFLAFTVTYFVVGNSLERASHDVISLKSEEVTSVLQAGGSEKVRTFFERQDHKDANASFLFRLLDAEGNVLFLKPSVQEKHFDFAPVVGEKAPFPPPLGWKTLNAVDDEDVFDLYTCRLRSGLYLQVGKSGEDRQAVLENIALVFGLVGILFVLGAAIFSRWYARRALSSLNDLLSGIRRIEMGNFRDRVAFPAEDEVNEIGRTFNQMVDKIEALIHGMKHSLDNVAHEIRTPLTHIRGVAEQALLARNPAAFQTALEECSEGAAEISALVAQVMSISEAEAGTLLLHREPTGIAQLVEDVLQVYEFVAQEKAIPFFTDLPPPDFTFWLDRRRVKQALANLIDNALKFSPASSRVEVAAQLRGDALEISVADEGPGISPADLPHIWERLYRGDKSRASSGTGLGLPIVRAIASAHGGNVSAENRRAGGAKFTLCITKPGNLLLQGSMQGCIAPNPRGES